MMCQGPGAKGEVSWAMENYQNQCFVWDGYNLIQNDRGMIDAVTVSMKHYSCCQSGTTKLWASMRIEHMTFTIQDWYDAPTTELQYEKQ